MNVAIQLKKIPFAKFPPAPPQSMLITLSGTMVISCLVNIVQGGGGMFYLGLGYSKIRQKRSSVSLILQPIVARSTRQHENMTRVFPLHYSYITLAPNIANFTAIRAVRVLRALRTISAMEGKRSHTRQHLLSPPSPLPLPLPPSPLPPPPLPSPSLSHEVQLIHLKRTFEVQMTFTPLSPPPPPPHLSPTPLPHPHSCPDNFAAWPISFDTEQKPRGPFESFVYQGRETSH